MAWLLAVLVPALVAGAGGKDSPLAHVTTLLQNLETKVQEEGVASATAYDEYACFCKEKITDKTDAITDSDDNLTLEKGNLKRLNGEKLVLTKDILQLEKDLDASDAAQTKATHLRENEHAEYAVAEKDASMAISQMTAAIAAIEAGGEAPLGDALLQVAATAKKHGLPTAALLAKAKTTGAHGDLLGALDDLKTSFDQRHADVLSDESSSLSAFNGAMDTTRTAYDVMKTSLSTKKEVLATTKEDIATTIESIDQYTELLKDDRAYLRELNHECEAKGKEWDQETTLRKNELTALGAAITILTGDAATTADTAGESPLLVQLPVQPSANLLQMPAGAEVLEDYTDVVSFVQTSSSSTVQRVAEVLRLEAKRQSSAVLQSVANKMSGGDPFLKVKSVIQKLIKELMTAAADEAEHKGWCDLNMLQARTERQNRQDAVTALNLQIEEEEAKQAELDAQSQHLAAVIASLDSAHLEMMNARQTEKDANRQTISESQDGMDALRSAITLIQNFYRVAGRAAVAGHAQHVGSTMQDDKGEAGVSGPTGKAYQGNQGGAAQVLGMLAVVEADFKRTRDTTMANDNLSERDFQSFSKETKSAIGAQKQAKKDTDEDHTRVTGDMESHMSDLRNEQTLVDGSIKMLEDLKPSCVFAGMSYEEKKRRSDAEINTLKYCVCILDTQAGDDTAECDAMLSFVQLSKPAFLRRH